MIDSDASLHAAVDDPEQVGATPMSDAAATGRHLFTEERGAVNIYDGLARHQRQENWFARDLAVTFGRQLSPSVAAIASGELSGILHHDPSSFSQP